MKQVADRVYSLGTKGHNFYLVREGDELTMIDAGCSKEWHALEQAVSRLGLGLGAISGVIATHAHADHFGLARKATEEGIGVEVHEDEFTRATGRYRGRFSAGARDLPLFRIHTLRTFLPMVRAGVMKLKFPPAESIGTFADGDVLDLPGNPRAVHTPGHTEGHVMFHLADTGLLFTGDGLATMNLLRPGSGPQMLADVFHLDANQARRSLDAIVGLRADVLLPGHGRPWKGSPEDAVSMARTG